MEIARLPRSKRRCVFFDRDGVVNESPGPGRYVLRWEDFHLIPQFPLCLGLTVQMGFVAVIVTNQRAVARGLMTCADVEYIHGQLNRLLTTEYRLALLDIVYCPHDNDQCSCRKPQPGMLLAMAEKHNLDLAASWMIGDSETDIEAGRQAGCRTILVGEEKAGSNANVQAPSMCILVNMLADILST